VYRSSFTPSPQLQTPYIMLGYNVVAAETDAEAKRLASSMQQAFVSLRKGHPIQLPAPRADYLSSLDPQERALLDQVLAYSAIGSSQTVARSLEKFIDSTGADELMITSQIFDHAARLRSYELTAEIHG
jgi:alkanesulfonate monooxygenase SsuD/methylene tetrahydromethanopterin reductase-like flavin-dependent oxidoreductase (luciferase family)